MKILIISPKNRTVYNFRGDLIKAMRARGHEVCVTGPDNLYLDKIESLGVTFYQVPVNKNGTSVIQDLKYMKALIKVIKREKPDITLGYTIKPVVYGSIAAKFSGVKNINSLITGGGYTLTAKTAKARLFGIIVKMLYKLGLGASTNIIFQNPDDLADFKKMHLVKTKKSHVVNGSGVNLEQFAPTEIPKQMRFFMLSRLLKSKGVCEYLEAAKIVKQKYPNVEFGILGKYEKEMQDAVPQEYMESFLEAEIVRRYDETTDVRPYYNDCSVYVLPSYREGTPRTVLEAMASGRPILTTDAIGCRETVVDGKNGFLVPVQDVKALADKMIWCIEHPENLFEMGKESLRYCEEKFDVNKVNQAMLQIINL